MVPVGNTEEHGFTVNTTDASANVFFLSWTNGKQKKRSLRWGMQMALASGNSQIISLAAVHSKENYNALLPLRPTQDGLDVRYLRR